MCYILKYKCQWHIAIFIEVTYTYLYKSQKNYQKYLYYFNFVHFNDANIEI